MNRESAHKRILTEDFDLCIIGGGITGAGILANAVQGGRKAILIDKNDFASGTSSRSSKMIHGGLRYLKMFQFGLVSEALHEREHLLHKYPELVKPLPFIMPSYHSFLDLNLKAFVIRFYGSLAGKSSLKKSQKLSKSEVLKCLPGFKEKNLKGGVLYWDGWTNDALLTIEVLKEAALNNAVVLNYCEAKQFEKAGDRLEGLKCLDRISGDEVTIRAKIFINASGVWTDNVLKLESGKDTQVMKPSKGVHVVVRNQRIASDYVAIVPSDTADKRYLYSFPWEHNLTVLGTTDTEYTGSADKVEATQSDIDYVLNTFNKSFPHSHLTNEDIVSVYAGLRPMLNEENDKGSYSRSREYRIWWSGNNFLNIAGGKLTSFLSMGEHCLKMADEKLPEKSALNPNSGNAAPSMQTILNEILKEENSFSKPLISGYKTTVAEVVYHTRYLFAQHVEDILTRRTALTYAMKNFEPEAIRATAAIMAKELKKEEQWITTQVNEYHEHWKEYHPDFLNA